MCCRINVKAAALGHYRSPVTHRTAVSCPLRTLHEEAASTVLTTSARTVPDPIDAPYAFCLPSLSPQASFTGSESQWIQSLKFHWGFAPKVISAGMTDRFCESDQMPFVLLE